jgi:hypothetical protein
MQPLGEAHAARAREQHQQVENDEKAGKHGELPTGAHLSLRW